ncbi:MAG: hypothetical protein C0412_19170 [Flavobacterium sp.]|nr:hypothetical protein [Flavobacterium sp.]
MTSIISIILSVLVFGLFFYITFGKKNTEENDIHKSEKNQLIGKNEQLIREVANLNADKTSLIKEKDRLVGELSNFKAVEKNREKEFSDNIQKLNTSQLALNDEKMRIRREDEEKLKKEEDERNRMWAEHEEIVKIKLTELCKSSQYAFQYYDNNNLPTAFGGKFKPDFLIEFLGQYVIFDAKKSESDLQNYISTNIKSTVEKINNNQDVSIYSVVFFIVPTDTIKSLRKINYYEQGYNFFVISPEAIEIVLALFKKINTYELAEQLDPRDRENIVNLIAEFDHHINMRNALDILASASGVSVLEKIETLRGDFKEDVFLKKDKIRLKQLSPTDIKTLMMSAGVQKEEIIKQILPKAAISEDNFKNAKTILKEKNRK